MPKTGLLAEFCPPRRDTLVIFTSDNGCSKQAGIPALREQRHYVSAHFRGSKADLWDGGYRVPFIVRWPGKVEPDSRCDQLITLVDFFATASEITGEKAPDMAEDSVSFLPALSGQPIISSRKGVIHHSISGHFAYRQGKWKLLLDRRRAAGGRPRMRVPPCEMGHRKHSSTTWKKTSANRTISTSHSLKSPKMMWPRW